MSSLARSIALSTAMTLLASALVAGLALAEPKEWDQKRVAALANMLASEVLAMKQNISKARETADPDSPRWVILDDLMQLQHRVVALVAMVNSGQGRDKTEPIYRRVKSAVENARQDAPAYPAVRREQRHIDAANTALRKLSEFYE